MPSGSLIATLPVPVLLASLLLLATVLSAWTRPIVWWSAAVATIVAGYSSGVLHGFAAVWLASLAVSVVLGDHIRSWWRVACLAWTGAVSLLLGIHLIPGFVNPAVIRDAVLAPDAVPYTQYLNFDKGLGALMLLLASPRWRPMRRRAELGVAVTATVPWLLATLIVVMAASLVAGYVRLEPRLPHLLWLWAPVNLLVTCVSEEAFFRGFVQRVVHEQTGGRSGAVLAAVVSAASFGVAHITGGWTYVALATVAGLGYAIVYQRTGRLEMAILTHFSVNLVHFVGFTYPALAR